MSIRRKVAGTVTMSLFTMGMTGGVAVVAAPPSAVMAPPTAAYVDGGVLYVTSLPGADNDLSIYPLGGRTRIWAPPGKPGVIFGDGCVREDGSGGWCQGYTSVVVDTGDGNDWVHVDGTGKDCRVNTGSGKDFLLIDACRADAGADADHIEVRAGATVLGGDGDDDILVSDLPGTAPREIFGGAGTDRVDFTYVTAPVSVTLDNVRDDGPRGNTTINVHTDVEQVDGSPGDDAISGSAVANVLRGGGGNDLLIGGGGNDTLEGGDGNDRLKGGAGFDTLIGGTGVDECDVGADGGTVSDDCEG
ncbi:calcium-binding protein [Embleya hyalina]|uniref:Bifunctional hemolysin/adenylate cyclase n=1 Tax=Embleya hyalina TaxID=516124 RepID=A0A401YWY5_9ACTN|nr:calcium-binding protein [Embleya hyalina]GCD99132.1 bifunctional hemolysin/adenylate cyclase [Embleya hyalina]